MSGSGLASTEIQCHTRDSEPPHRTRDELMNMIIPMRRSLIRPGARTSRRYSVSAFEPLGLSAALLGRASQRERDLF